jgi:hypothetical protein
MNQLENLGAAANHLVHVVHESSTGAGLAPVPTLIILSLAAMFALVGLVVGGRGRARQPRHAHTA